MAVRDGHTMGSDAIRYNPLAEHFQRDLYDVYRRLRDEQPVYRHPSGRFWAISCYNDVVAVLSSWTDFSSSTPNVPEPAGHLAVQDPPRHDELRRLVAHVFTPRSVTELLPLVAAIADRLVDELRDADHVDLMSRFASELPSRVFAALMGITPDEQLEFDRLIAEYLDALTTAIEGGVLDDGPRQRTHAVIERLINQHRADPRDDLLSALLAAEVDGARLSDEEVAGFCFNLILAANETTTNLIANGIALLLTHPDQRALLATRPDLLDSAIEEMLRYDSPVQALSRTTTRNIEIGETVIPEGSLVQVLYGSANRDPSAFADPDRFDITRPPSRHLAFGQGIHFCLGAQLARLEARGAFSAILPLLDHFELDDDALAWKRSPWQRSLRHLSLRRV